MYLSRIKNQEGHGGYCWCRWVEISVYCDENNNKCTMLNHCMCHSTSDYCCTVRSVPGTWQLHYSYCTVLLYYCRSVLYCCVLLYWTVQMYCTTTVLSWARYCTTAVCTTILLCTVLMCCTQLPYSTVLYPAVLYCTTVAVLQYHTGPKCTIIRQPALHCLQQHVQAVTTCVTLSCPFQLASPPGFHITCIPKGNLVHISYVLDYEADEIYYLITVLVLA